MIWLANKLKVLFDVRQSGFCKNKKLHLYQKLIGEMQPTKCTGNKTVLR